MNALIESHRNQIRALAEKRGIRNVRLFGSMARDSATPSSDVDFSGCIGITWTQGRCCYGEFLAYAHS